MTDDDRKEKKTRARLRGLSRLVRWNTRAWREHIVSLSAIHKNIFIVSSSSFTIHFRGVDASVRVLQWKKIIKFYDQGAFSMENGHRVKKGGEMGKLYIYLLY